MKNIVYMVISSVIVLGILALVIDLIRGDVTVVTTVANNNNDTAKVSAEGMISQEGNGEIIQGKTYAGSELISFIRANEKNDNINITINFKGTYVEQINKQNGTSIADDSRRTIDGNGTASNPGIKSGYYTAGGKDIGYIEADYEATKVEGDTYEFKIK